MRPWPWLIPVLLGASATPGWDWPVVPACTAPTPASELISPRWSLDGKLFGMTRLCFGFLFLVPKAKTRVEFTSHPNFECQPLPALPAPRPSPLRPLAQPLLPAVPSLLPSQMLWIPARGPSPGRHRSLFVPLATPIPFQLPLAVLHHGSSVSPMLMNSHSATDMAASLHLGG